ncbi:hypothetical protein F5890DRAFT_1441376 [Lentinula detonsa]|uniref:Btz domain-containing protein n=1 Tax=Lentinula detonsa TaxID=2804962 RepID=A0AA38PYT4_9AGAR|nr:hypothetical protein F5890DRAFT_1441376 [Lentinula detonsa]
MPALVASSTSATANMTADNSFAPRTGGSHSKRRRFGRRRGRKPNLDSDDEVEREVRTDSESEADLSSSESTSDSDTEPASEDVLPNEQSRVLTPSTSQSPTKGASHLLVSDHNQPFFGSSGDWSEMVANEVENGPESLPVIDFTELDSQILPLPNQSRKSKKNQKHNDNRATATATSLPSASTAQLRSVDDTEESRAPSSHSAPRRPPGQSARQAYQQRLDADPSYVPTVGEFWGHDDRLLDKNLRSLSGWWRGRRQGGIRGRGGFVRGPFRGRGGFLGRPVPGIPAAAQDMEEDGVQPVNQAWTHDGFEELKRNDEHSASSPQQVHHSAPLRRPDAPRGPRGSFASRGGWADRASFSPSFRARSLHSDPGRVWFLKKPEHMWTKQAESFLFSDPSSKPRAGQPASVRVKLPCQKTAPIRVPMQSIAQTSTSNLSTSRPESEIGDRTLVVRIPKSAPLETPEVAETVENPPTGEPSIEEVFTVRPRLVSPKPIPLPEQPASWQAPVSLPNGTHTSSSSISSIDPIIQQKLEQLSLGPQKTDSTRWVQTEEAVMRNPTGTVPDDLQEQPPLSSIPHNFTSSDQVSPSYGSPYQYAPQLPPGLVINPAGITYEVATGRPVYLQPPSNMYPPPMMQPVPFVPGHVHHPSSSDFLPVTAGTPPINGGGYIEYTPTPPLFSYPRQSSRIRIRAPDEPRQQHSSTELRSDAAAFEPSEQYFPEGDSLATDQQVQDPMMGYYNPYYYPDLSYGYNPYVDMSQVAPYEMYPPQGTVYYQ